MPSRSVPSPALPLSPLPTASKTTANNMLSQISTSEISDMVLEQLKKLDEVAYVRFASVNKDFSDVDCFLDLISDLRKDK